MRALLLVGMLLVLSCSPEPPAVVELRTEPPAAPSPAASPSSETSSASSPPSTATEEPRYTCESRGLPWLNPCPGGGIERAEVSQPDTLAFCCASGDVGRVEGIGCMTALEAAKVCGDAETERAVLARLDAAAKYHGEPCMGLMPENGQPTVWRSLARLCRERGFPVP